MTRAQLEALQARCAHLERCLQSQELVVAASAPSAPASPGHLSSEDIAPSEGRLLHDPEGTARYFGGSSGANFLNHVKEFIGTILPLIGGNGSAQPGGTFLASLGRYQTFDSRPLHLPHVDSLWLPSRTEMTVMLAEFRYFLHDGNQDFFSGGIFYWEEVASVVPDPQAASGLRANSNLALLNMVFALAARLGSAEQWDDKRQSEAYLSRARMNLGNPLDIAMYTARDVSVLLLMGLYLLEMNRRDAAYMTVGMAMRLAVVHGAHTRCSQDEGSKRVFWTLYILDSWLSLLLGRPPGIADEAIRLDPPQEIT